MDGADRTGGVRRTGAVLTAGFGRRRLLTAGAALGGGLLVSSCSASVSSNTRPSPARAFTGAYDGPPLRLDFWNPFTGGDGPTMGKIVDAFNAAHPNITVRMTSMGADDLYAKIVPAVGAARGPDIAIIHLDQLPMFALRGTILRLDEVVDALGLGADQYIPTVWQPGEYRGHRYGIPLDVFTELQYWNTSAFGKAGVSGPVTGDRFDATMSALQRAGHPQPFWMTPNWQLYVTLLAQYGGRLVDESGERVLMGSQASIEALAWMRRQVDRGYSPANVTDARAPFKNGSEVLLADLPAAIPDLQDTAAGLDWGVSTFPQIGDRPGMFANSHNFTLTRQSQRDDHAAHAAMTFISWVSQNSAGWSAGGNIPANNQARKTPLFAKTRQAPLATEETFSALAFLSPIPNSRDIAANSYQRAVSQVVLGQARPDEAARAAARNAQEQLDTVRKVYGI